MAPPFDRALRDLLRAAGCAFWLVIRNFAIGDAAVSGEMTTAYVATFDEDRDLLREIQNLQDEGEACSLSLAIDVATVRLRRQIERRIGAERSGSALQASG